METRQKFQPGAQRRRLKVPLTPRSLGGCPSVGVGAVCGEHGEGVREKEEPVRQGTAQKQGRWVNLGR